MSISIDLAGDVAVVTGGGSGIGEAIALDLGPRGRRGRRRGPIPWESAQRVAKQIEADGGRALAVALDIADRASVKAGLAAVREGLGPVKHLVNNAATWEVKSFADHTAADIDRVAGVTLTGTMTITQVAALPDIVGQRGTVVVISSDSARIGERYMSVYAAAKAGLLGFIKSVAREVGRQGVRVNAIAPGTTNTPGGSGFIEQAGGAEKLARAYPLGCIGEPQDIANAALFLVSPLSSWMTGQVLSVSGGFTDGMNMPPRTAFRWGSRAGHRGRGGDRPRSRAPKPARRCARIVVNDADGPVAKAVADEISAVGGQAVASHDSVATPAGGAAIVDQALDAFGQLDIVVSNAGILRDKSFGQLTPDLVDAVLDVHLRGAFHVLIPAWRHMKQRGYGRIVTTTSASACSATSARRTTARPRRPWSGSPGCWPSRVAQSASTSTPWPRPRPPG